MIDVDEAFGLLLHGNIKSYSIAKMVSLLDDKFNIDSEKAADGLRIPDFTIRVRHKMDYLLEYPSSGPLVLPYSTTVYITLSSWRTDDNEFYNTYNRYAGTNFVAQNINRVFFVTNVITMTHVIALAVLTKINNVPGIYLQASPSSRWERAHIEYRVSYNFDVQEPDYLVATMKYTSRVLDSL